MLETLTEGLMVAMVEMMNCLVELLDPNVTPSFRDRRFIAASWLLHGPTDHRLRTGGIGSDSAVSVSEQPEGVGIVGRNCNLGMRRI